MLFSLSLRIQVSLVTSSDGFDVFLWKVIKPSSLSASVPLCNSDTIVIDFKYNCYVSIRRVRIEMRVYKVTNVDIVEIIMLICGCISKGSITELPRKSITCCSPCCTKIILVFTVISKWTSVRIFTLE